MKYTAQHFRDGLPAWKRRKDTLLTKLIFRELSFYVSAFCANLGISANSVSVFSSFVAIISCAMFLFGHYALNIIGTVIIFFWYLLDCVDGNLARSVRPQPFGEFVDAESCYILGGLLGVCLGVSVYQTGGFWGFQGSPWIIFFGALASICDILVRLIYQKYQNVAKDLSKKKIIPPQREKRTEHEYSGSLRVWLEQEPGIGGILPLFILIAAIFNALDLIIFYMLLYSGGGAVVFITLYTVKAMRFRNLPMESQL